VRLFKHNKKGNCSDNQVIYSCKECGKGECCDVCHEHDEPRGECSECEPCPKCDAETPKE
jgi:hypothetical protein